MHFWGKLGSKGNFQSVLNWLNLAKKSVFFLLSTFLSVPFLRLLVDFFQFPITRNRLERYQVDIQTYSFPLQLNKGCLSRKQVIMKSPRFPLPDQTSSIEHIRPWLINPGDRLTLSNVSDNVITG